MLNEQLLKKIKKERRIKELRQKDIAEKLNISIPTYSRFENGITKADYNFIKEVCSILDLDFYKLENNPADSFNEDSETYNITPPIVDKNYIEISNQLKTLLALLEKQQQTNVVILKKLKLLTSKKS